VRLSSALGPKLDWLFGAFYTHESSKYVEDIAAENPATLAIVANGLLNDSFPTTYEEYAAFTDFTVHITDQFDIQLGGRESEIRQSFTQTETGVYTFAPGDAIFIPESRTDANAFTYLVTPRLKLSQDLMLYARLASGYRAGGANGTPGGIVPPEYRPDKTENYEIGVKGDFIDHLLSVDASLYYIDWKDIQIQLLNPATEKEYNTNGSRAKSEGAELSLEVRPFTGLAAKGWVAWDDAVLTQAFPATSTVYGADGDRLPYSSRYSGNISVEEEFPISSQWNGYVGGVVSYVGDREGVFRGETAGVPQPRQDLPGYARADIHAGVKYDSWTTNFYLNNVADRRGVLEGGLGGFPPFGFMYIQPRTVGVSVTKIF
jgi:iron complex outermembrane recepter protein